MSRKGPSLSATLFEVGQLCTGNDGNLWIVGQTKNSTHRWIIKNKGKHAKVICKAPYANPFKSTGSKFLVHDNGREPFLVSWSPRGRSVSIYKKSKEYYNLPWEAQEKVLENASDKTKLYTQLIKKYSNVKKVFPGRDYSGYAEHGNTVLIELPQSKYVFVGESIYEFTGQPIINYYSYLGPNDVPYPVALSADYAYFMLDKVYISRDEFPKSIDWSNAYIAFYGHDWPSESVKKHNQLKKIKMKGLKIIHTRDQLL